MNNKFDYQAILDGFEDFFDFPLEQRHSGQVYISNDIDELKENDSAFGEYWSNYLDMLGLQADFDYDDLISGQEEPLFEYWFKRMTENALNGNWSDVVELFEELKEEHAEGLRDMLVGDTQELAIYRKMLTVA